MRPNGELERSGEIDQQVAEIPAFNSGGFLPSGLHEACFEDVIERFGTNRTRRALSQKLEKFLLTVIDSKNFSHAYLGGDFTTSDPSPSGVDVILQTKARTGPFAFLAIQRLCELGFDDICKKYSLRLSFWVEDSLDEVDTASNFFADSPTDLKRIVSTLPRDGQGLLQVRL